jgi:hypothetical protein
MFFVMVKHTLGAGAVRLAVASVCSRDVNAGFSHRGRNVAIAASAVSKQRAAGVVGGPASATAPASRARSVAESKVNAIASVNGNAS